MKNRKWIIIIVCIVVVFVGFKAYNSSPRRLYGEWEAYESKGSGKEFFPSEMELYSNGMMNLEGFTGSWTANDGKLTINVFLSVSSYEYKMQGFHLVLKDGNQTVYYKKK